MAVHNDPPDKPTEKQYTRFLVDSPLEVFFSMLKNCIRKIFIQVSLVRSHPRSEEFERTLKESCRLFQKYQMNIHKDNEIDCDQASFVDFLVKSPLEVHVYNIDYLYNNNCTCRVTQVSKIAVCK